MIADIAPVDYPPRYRTIADAMLALPLDPGLTRATADAALADAVPDTAMRQFLLSNLRFGDAPSWRIGLPAIAGALPAIEGWDWSGEGVYAGPTLVLRGERSDYIKPDDPRVIPSSVPFRPLRGVARCWSLAARGRA